MPGTLPPARARVLTRAGLVALLAALRVISMIDFYVPFGPSGQTGHPPGPRAISMIGFHFSYCESWRVGSGCDGWDWPGLVLVVPGDSFSC
jgi:hypothetical protein